MAQRICLRAVHKRRSYHWRVPTSKVAPKSTLTTRATLCISEWCRKGDADCNMCKAPRYCTRKNKLYGYNYKHKHFNYCPGLFSCETVRWCSQCLFSFFSAALYTLVPCLLFCSSPPFFSLLSLFNIVLVLVLDAYKAPAFTIRAGQNATYPLLPLCQQKKQ